ncbi:MAG: 50S ribosomal protein L11 methyltransferase [Neisseriaceae bacterium]
MPLQQLKVVVGSGKAELLADRFLEAGALSVAIEDAHVDTEKEEVLFDEPDLSQTDQGKPFWNHSLILALFREEAPVLEITQKLLKELAEREGPIQISKVPDKDWVRLIQSQFNPIAVGDRLWIVPSWHKVSGDMDRVIKLDPGLAFGTGSHPTTFLCLSWLELYLKPGTTVLDYGCGSGILAIAASKLGAKKVCGIDIDPQAVLASQDNAKSNGIEAKFFLPKDFHLEEKFDVVVANILANPLRLLAPMLANYVKAGGVIVLSGLLDVQQKEIARLYEEWFHMSLYREKEGWACLTGRKK